jgi:hypothetical protein
MNDQAETDWTLAIIFVAILLLVVTIGPQLLGVTP